MSSDNMASPCNIFSEDLMIPSDTAEIELHLRNKRRADLTFFSADRTIVLMHGATFPAESLFDVPLAGRSFMDVLAQAGFDVWFVDARGYGGSTRPPEMSEPPDGVAPLTPTLTAVRDLASACTFIRGRRGLDRSHVLGLSWGGSIAGAYASTHNDAVEKLVLVAPLWLSMTPLRIDPGTPLGAYRFANVRAYEAAWRVQAPENKRAGLVPGDWFATWARATLATDPASPKEGTIRAPSGAVNDVRNFWTIGRKLYEPSEITRPVLLVRGEWDVDVHFDMVTSLFAELTGTPYRRRVEVAEASHMILSEKNRDQAYDAIIAFLTEHFEPETGRATTAASPQIPATPPTFRPEAAELKLARKYGGGPRAQ
jgi:pimeloyl-ACP methyl ester carboxylesterase